MKRVSPSRILAFTLIILLCIACENEIQLFPEEIPANIMVYGIMDANSADQNVKIRKTFGGNTNLVGMAGNPDLFSPPESMKVRIEEYTDEGVIDHPLTRELFPKDPGLFSDDENVVFQGSFWTKEAQRYDLIIEDTLTGEVIRSSTMAVAPPIVRFPTAENVSYNFNDTINPFYVKYKPTGVVHFQQFFINYVEILHSGDTLYKTATFELRPKFKHPLRRVITYTRTYHKEYVLNIMRMLILQDEEVRERQLHSFEFAIWAGDEYLRDYIKLAERFNDNRRQYFSNIEGGLGLFASCAHTRIEGIWPRTAFYNVLANTEKLSHLSFSAHRFKDEFRKGALPPPSFKSLSSSGVVNQINPD
jgi:hypothetical protein